MGWIQWSGTTLGIAGATPSNLVALFRYLGVPVYFLFALASPGTLMNFESP
jgi:hypothetical protein